MKKVLLLSVPIAFVAVGLALANDTSFSDVTSATAHATAIGYVHEQGIVDGFPDGTYGPTLLINRAEFTKIMVNARHMSTVSLCKIATFPDAPLSSWFGPYVQAARCAGMIDGYPDGTFQPAQNINVAEAAKIIVEAYGFEHATGSAWYSGYMNSLTQRGALPTDASDPSTMLTRGAMAEIIYRLETGTTSDDADDTSDDTGLLPLGDGLYSTSPKMGYIYSCQTTFNGRGAFKDGEWIQGDWWDPSLKPTVDGRVFWSNARFSITDGSSTRTITANLLPVDTPTGNYPVSSTDDAYNYDRNPNSIEEQSLTLSLPMNPEVNNTPSCVPMGLIGVALNGVAIFNGFDAEGRDAAAHEILDECQGHPQQEGMYHYHAGSDCLEEAHATGQSPLFGYALDGFGIYGKYDENGHELTSADLDECHGRTSTVEWNGSTQVMYHYVLTDDYPYSIACFRGTPVDTGVLGNDANGSMEHSAAGQQGGSGGPPQAAISACNGKTSGSCSFSTPNGTMNGTCRTTPDGVVACVP